jgi:hypothetical protein
MDLSLVAEALLEVKTGIFTYTILYGVFRVLKNAHRMPMFGEDTWDKTFYFLPQR